MVELSVGQYSLIYNTFSFTLAVMAAATVFFWMNRVRVHEEFKTALTVTGLVTFIAAYHYLQIFLSWDAAYDVVDGSVQATDARFNDAYRYVDWLLTVPLLLVELILVMGFSRSETVNKATRLGVLAALMIILGYPGETADTVSGRWIWGILSMIPFLWIVYELFVGLQKSIDSQPEDVKGLVSAARWVTVGSWAFYPVVYFAAAIGLSGALAETIIQVGYSLADITSKAAFGLLIYTIALRKSQALQGSTTTGRMAPAE